MISVILPNYNHAAFLKERIDTILCQSFQSFELIILDDASTDNSSAIIESYRGHEKITHIVYNTSNSGSTFMQWQKGIALAKGDWIWIAESDDFCELDFLAAFMDKNAKNDNMVLYFCASKYTDTQSSKDLQLTWWGDESGRDWTKDYCIDGKDEIKDQFFVKNIIPNASAVVFKKEKVKQEVFSVIANMKFAGDWYFWVHLAEQGNIVYNSRALNYFRTHAATTRKRKSSQQEYQRFLEYFTVINYIKNKYKVNWDVDKHNWIFHEWLAMYKYMHVNFYDKMFPFPYQISICQRLFKHFLIKHYIRFKKVLFSK